MKKLMSIAILFCGLMLSGCLENLSEKEYPTIELEPTSMGLVGILVQAQSDKLLVSDIVVNRGNCKVVSAEQSSKGAEVNQERVNVLIEKGMTEEELGKLNIHFNTKSSKFVVGRNLFGFDLWNEKGRQLGIYHPFELKFGEKLLMMGECKADSILEIVLKTDKGDLFYDFKN